MDVIIIHFANAQPVPDRVFFFPARKNWSTQAAMSVGKLGPSGVLFVTRQAEGVVEEGRPRIKHGVQPSLHYVWDGLEPESYMQELKKIFNFYHGHKQFFDCSEAIGMD